VVEASSARIGRDHFLFHCPHNVYRGRAIPDLVGSYVMADFESGKLWMASESGGTWTRTLLLSTGRNISSLGQDASGEIHVVDYNGSVLKVVPE